MSMSTPTNPPTPSKQKPKKYKDKDKDRDRKEKVQLPGERLKIVVRRLPPNLPEEIFWQSVANWVTDETVSWKAFYPGKPKKRANKENVPTRAYIAFKTLEQLQVFGREYDDHKFVDKAGNESFAVVEYAPYQKVPGEKKKPDSRHATIEKDEDYISFIESLKAPSATETVSIETLVASTRPTSPPKTTPLLEALKAEKQAQKDKEAIIRNHPHYKDILNGPSPSALRKEERRKAARAEAAAKKAKKAAAATAGASSKPVQIQAKLGASSPSQNGNVAPAPSKIQPSPARPSRKHAAKASKEAAQPPLNVAQKDNPPPPADVSTAVSPTQAQRPAQDATPVAPAAAAPARRGRPVLGIGSRHFEAALSGVGVTGERKRREKGKEKATSPSPGPGLQEGASQEKPNPPTSPKRPRPRKEGQMPDSGGVGGRAMPTVTQVDAGGLTPQMNRGRGGKRGGGRGGGRGRGGPPGTG